MSDKYAWEDKDVDQDAARELHLYIDNDSELYRRQYVPIQKNLITKKARGVYDHTKAVKLFGYLVESGAKKYYKDFGFGGREWSQMFPKKLRDLVAEELTNHFEVEAALGNYDNYLPKKYQKAKSTVTVGPKKRKTSRKSETSMGGTR